MKKTIISPNGFETIVTGWTSAEIKRFIIMALGEQIDHIEYEIHKMTIYTRERIEP